MMGDPAAQQAIRPATADDDALLAGVIARSFRTVAVRFGLTPDNCPKHPSNARPDWIETHRSRGACYFVVEHQGAALGCVALEPARDKPGVCYLERLAVLPEHRGRGLGDLLVEHAHTVARDWGMARVELAIIAQQGELRMWYERRGYVATRTHQFSHLPFLVMFMARDL